VDRRPVFREETERMNLLLAYLVGVTSLAPAPVDTVPLYDGLGDHHHDITTSSPLAQKYFDQGLRLVYAFNHGEAVRAFEQAVRLDPDCAMCDWGIALALGPNINAAMDSTSAVRAHEAIQRARDRVGEATAGERALIEALAERYEPSAPVERAALDSAYARAMTRAARDHPNDPDAVTLAADAIMNLSPWNYWTADGEPRPGTDEVLGLLESALQRDLNHPGACHLYIHAVEAAHPAWAVECAERLAGLMPAAGHLVHMPGHIYIRVGRYMDAVHANEHAVHADEVYIADQSPDGMYPEAYYPHNYHFMAFAAMMAGRSEQAVSAARAVASRTPLETTRETYFLENVPAYPHLMMTTFGLWDEILAEPMPQPELRTASGMAEYARGVAHAATGDWGAAEAALGRLVRFAVLRMTEGETPAQQALSIAIHALTGEIAMRRGEPDEAAAHFSIAVELEDAMLYDEPPLWYHPIRQSLGRALIEAERWSEAEGVYRADLEKFPDNGWSLFGLAQCLEAQGRTGEADIARERFEAAWSQADVGLTASRF
jgi:tetratricopeptide (TPR) repeat protein